MNSIEALSSGKKVRRLSWGVLSFQEIFANLTGMFLSANDVVADDWVVQPEGFEEWSVVERKDWVEQKKKSLELKAKPETACCPYCKDNPEVMKPVRFLNENKLEEKLLFCSQACFVEYCRENGIVEIYPGIYGKLRMFVEEPSEEVREMILKFLDNRFSCREDWERGLSFYDSNSLSELLEQFLFWWVDHQDQKRTDSETI